MTIGTIFLGHLSVIGKYNLLIFTMFCLFSCHSVKEQQENKKKEQQENPKYDSLTQRNVYIFVEKMPEYNGGDMAFLTDFGKVFQYDFSKNKEESIQTKLQVQFVIDTDGNLIGARINNKTADEITAFETAGLKALNLMQDWQSGEHNGKSVNVLITKTIHIGFNP